MLIFAIIILVAVAISIIVLPFFQKDMSSEEPQKIDFTLTELEEEKEDIYLAIKEAEFEHKIGKLSDEDLKSVTDSYSAEAVAAMKKIEEHKKGATKTTKASAKQCPNCKIEVKVDARFCPACGSSITKAPEANICPSCGAKHKKDDKFCGNCGQPF